MRGVGVGGRKCGLKNPARGSSAVFATLLHDDGSPSTFLTSKVTDLLTVSAKFARQLVATAIPERAWSGLGYWEVPRQSSMHDGGYDPEKLDRTPLSSRSCTVLEVLRYRLDATYTDRGMLSTFLANSNSSRDYSDEPQRCKQ
ncbi:unnamed protein product [Peniophora sp. CBMAI 1063]|nr:unnamed protein product [Peniophora sp. CBMAI 1063]